MDYHEYFRYLYADISILTVEDLADLIEGIMDELDRFIEELDRKKEQMGAFDNAQKTITIPESAEEGKKWGWDPHESVTARVTVTMADEEWVNNQVLKAISGKKRKQGLDIQSNLGATRLLWVQRMIKSWTFTQNGKHVPISPEAIRALPSHYADRIYDAIMDAQPESDDEEEAEAEEEDFTNDASAIIVEADEHPNHLMTTSLLRS